MNRLYSFVVFIFLFLFSHSVFAETCSVKGNKDYVVQFQVVGLNDYQDVAFSHGNGNNQKKFVLWYTQQERSGDYSFNEQGLILGHTYTVRIEVEHTTGNSNIANYYWVENGVKVFKETQNDVAANGDLEGTGTNISNLECGESVDLPEPEDPPEFPEFCEVFPAAIQSWTKSSTFTLGGGVEVIGTHKKMGNVGFGSVVDGGSWQTDCDGHRCIATEGLIATPPDVIAFTPGSVNIHNPTNTDIPSGQYNEIKLDGAQKTYNFIGTDYDIKTLHVSGSAILSIGAGTKLRLHDFELSGGGTIVVEGDNSDNLLIWAESLNGVEPRVLIDSTSLTANIFSRGDVKLDGSAFVNGSITGKSLNLLGSAKVSRSSDSCEIDLPLPDICPYFPEPIQSNLYYGSTELPWGASLNFRSGVGSGNQLFLTTTDPLSFHQASSSIQGEGGCVYGGSTTTCSMDTNHVLYEGGNPPIPNNYAISGVDISVPNSGLTLTPGHYADISFNSQNSAPLTLEGGEYWVNELNFNRVGASLQVNGPVVLHYKRLSITRRLVKINTNSATSNLTLIGHYTNSNIDIRLPTNSNQPRDGIEINANIYISPEALNGFFSNTPGFKMTGAFAAPKFEFSSTNSQIRALAVDGCGTTPPPVTNYSLSLTPAQGIQLTCTAQQLDLQVKDSSGNNTGAYTGDIEVTATGGTNTSFNVLQGSSQGGNLYKANSNGLLSLSMDENTVSDVVVRGSLQDDPSATSVTGNYKFVAYKLGFSPNPTNVVAGKPSESVSVQPLECLNDAPVVSTDYNGAKQVELSATNYIAPSSTARPNEVIKVNGSTTPQGSMNLDFGSNSTANIQVEYAEAGSVSYTMTDEICIDDGQGSQECREYSGEHQIQSRPWTFALCEPSGADISGTSNSGSVFKRSGELFALNATPIRWVSNESTAPNVAIDVSNYCNQLDTLATKNFYADSALAVSVNLSAELDSPSAGELGSGLEGIPPNGLAHNTDPLGPITFTSLFWKEAGSLKVTADLTNQADYLFEPINPGYRTVGRFSPSQLVMLDETSDPSNVWTQWQYASNHDGFAYMSQQFPHSFKVQAQANDGTPTLNYGLFGNDYISTLDYMANTTGLATDVSLLNRVANTQTWTGADWPKTLAENPSILSVQMDDFAFMKKVDSTVGSFIATEPDGPFNSSNSIFGLEVTTIIDDVNFSVLDMPDVSTGTNVGSAFPEQPEFRYGRMHLEDVGGNTGQTVRVPLRVEYWDDGEFKTNDKDSGSEYDATNHYCVQTIWNNQAATTNAALISGGNQGVAQGLSDELHAEHVPTSTANTERAQVRLWLRQADDSPQRSETNIDCSKATSYTNQPWLQYNWRDKGDEDPSAVVTFGVFRGNDRIIFKGERALIGNEN